MKVVKEEFLEDIIEHSKPYTPPCEWEVGGGGRWRWEVGGGGGRWEVEVEVGGGRWEVEVGGGGGGRWEVEVEVGGGRWEVEVGGGRWEVEVGGGVCVCVCVHHVHGMSSTVCVPLSFLHWCMCTAEIRKRTDPARASSFSSQAAQQQERVIEPNECVGGSVGGFCVSMLGYRCMWNVGES